MPRALSVILGGLLATGMSVPAAWAFPTSRLTYSRDVAAQQCPDEAFLRRAVAARIGYDPFFPWATRTIAARIAVEGHILRGTVDLIDARGILRGSRDLSALPHQCEELVVGMALAISIAVDPDSVDRVDPPSPTASGTGGAPIDSSVPPAPLPGPVLEAPRADDDGGTREPATPRPAASSPGPNESGSSTRPTGGFRLTPELHAGVVGSAGLAPSWGAGPSVSAFLRASAWLAGVEGRYQFVNGANYPAGRISSTLVGAAALTCGHPGPAMVCAQVAADRLTVSGDGVDRPRSDAAFVWRTGVRAGLDFSLRANLALGVHADVLFLLEPTSIVLDGQVLWRAPLVSALGGATLQGRFP
jgi:hypothetical protein